MEKLIKKIQKLEDKSFKKYVNMKVKDADYYLELGKCNAYGNVLEILEKNKRT